MLNDDLLIDLGEKLLSKKELKGDLVMIKGHGDGFFFDPINKMMICMQRGSTYCKVKENYDSAGRSLLYDYNSGSAFMIDDSELIKLEAN